MEEGGALKREIEYFDSEGRSNFEAVLKVVEGRAAADDVDAIVLFAATREGVELALGQLRDAPQPVVVATFRHEAKSYRETDDGEIEETLIGLTPADEEELRDSAREFSLVRAALPLSDEIVVLRYADPKLAGIREALRMISGALPLVVQAVMVSCDAGCISEGDRVIAFSGDTAILVTAAHSDSLFFPDVGMEIHEILCKPSRLTLTRQRSQPEGDEESSRPGN